jgi:hypothetical protein
MEAVDRVLELLDEEDEHRRSVAALRRRLQDVELFALREALDVLQLACDAHEERMLDHPRRYETLS